MREKVEYITLLRTGEGWTVDAMATQTSVQVYLFTRPVSKDVVGRGLDATRHSCELRGWVWSLLNWGCAERRSLRLAHQLVREERRSLKHGGVIARSEAALLELAEPAS